MTPTIRQEINAHKRKAAIVVCGAFGLFAIGSILSPKYEAFVFLAVAGFVGFMAGIIFLMWRIRCPKCGGGIGFVTAQSSSPFSISGKIKFCPFCGISLDSSTKGHVEV